MAQGFKRGINKGKWIIVLFVVSLKPQYSMQGRSVLPFFHTKKNPALRGEEEGLINPAISESFMYFSIFQGEKGCQVNRWEVGHRGEGRWNNHMVYERVVIGLALC